MRSLAAAALTLLLLCPAARAAIPETAPPSKPGPRVEVAPARVAYVACGALEALDRLLQAAHVGDAPAVRGAFDRGCGFVSAEMLGAARLVFARWDRIEVYALDGGVEIFVYRGFSVDLEEVDRGRAF